MAKSMFQVLMVVLGFSFSARAVTVIPNEIPRLGPQATLPGSEVLYGSIRASDSTLRRVIVTRPEKPGRFPAVLFIGGIGCYSLDETRDHVPDSYLEIVKSVAARGLVSLRVEKSKMGESEGAGCENDSFETELSGYQAGLKYLKSLPFVDSAHIVIIGHSMGGLFAPLIAVNDPVAGMIAIATLGQSWLTYEIENSRRQLALAGTADAEIESQIKKLREFQTLFHGQNLSFEEILRQRPDLKDFATFMMSENFLRQLGRLDMLSVWQKVSGKVLALHGKADFITSAEDHERIAAAVQASSHGVARHVEIAHLDHFFWQSETEADSFASVNRGGAGAVLNMDFIRQLADIAAGM